ncbi:hypothetical protein Ae263Ps1_6419 [Pseudonocardia sp. Ae263_Ps1]|nr:hypothetical protein Ae263Ps1_6419 [Pseudonocardia sp. Ae263_Ps1]
MGDRLWAWLSPVFGVGLAPQDPCGCCVERWWGCSCWWR